MCARCWASLLFVRARTTAQPHQMLHQMLGMVQVPRCMSPPWQGARPWKHCFRTLLRDLDIRIEREGAFEESVNKKVADISGAHSALAKSVDNCSKNLSTFKKELAVKDEEVKKRMDTLQQNCINSDGRESQMRDMDSKFRHELEKIRNNESGKCTKSQVEIERNLETKLEELAEAFREHKATNKSQIGDLTNRLDQALTEEKEMWQIGKSQNAEWQSMMSNQL